MSLTLDKAQAVITCAHERAGELGTRVTAAIVDEGGLPQALGRTDGAPRLSAQIAEAQAASTSLFHRDGASLRQMQETWPAFFDQVGRIPRLPVLIRREDAILCAVAVSGGLPEQDDECAEAGLAALTSKPQ
jgi:glc operon protein GlcG